jgi:CheY-like chemotaxis protein
VRLRDGVRVSDDGIGIAPEMLPGVFEMFSQVGRNLDRSQGGLGIGLTLVRRLTEMHGGTVEAASPGIGCGSTFTIRLPLVSVGPAPVASAAAPDSVALDTPARRLRVLIVDDNVDGASALAMLVAMRGHETRTAHDGPAALAEIALFSPHVVFCDIGLPGLNGYEVASRVRAIEDGRGGGRTTLVSLTGWGSDENKRHSLSAGFDLHLTKPVDAGEIEALLEQTCLAFGTDDPPEWRP